jgi:hypothetical protein
MMRCKKCICGYCGNEFRREGYYDLKILAECAINGMPWNELLENFKQVIAEQDIRNYGLQNAEMKFKLGSDENDSQR